MPNVRVNVSQEAFDELLRISSSREIEPWVAASLLLESRLIAERKHDVIATYAEMKRRADKVKPSIDDRRASQGPSVTARSC